MIITVLRKWYLRRTDSSRISKSDRWLRLVIWLTLANSLHLIAVCLLPRCLEIDQAKDALLRAAETPGALWGVAMFVPALLAAVALAASSALVGMAIRTRMMSITSGSISGNVVDAWCVIVYPAILVIGVATYATLAASLSGMSGIGLVGLFVSITSVGVIHALVSARQKGDFRRYRLFLAALLLICVGFILATSFKESWAINVGAVALVLIGIIFWSTVLTQAFIGIPVSLNWLPASVGWIATIIGALIVFHASNPYRMPSARTPPVDAETLKPRTSEDSTEAFFSWLEDRLPEDEDSLIPVFLVSANGGGIRTGYYAARTLALLEQESQGRFSRNIFAYSGVSGGSLGVATFVNSVSRNAGKPSGVLREIDGFFARDFLSPVAGRLVIGDLLKFGFNLQSLRSRDQVFESRLHQEWLDVTGTQFFNQPMFLALGSQQVEGVRPAWVTFSATIAETGARLELSNLVTQVRRDRGRSYFSYHRDVRIPMLTVAQAVHMSARFPGFSPPASLQAEICERARPDAECEWHRRHWITIVDGGYNDNSGLAPLVATVNKLTCLRDRDTRPCRSPNGRKYDSRPLSEDPAIAERRKKLLARVRFFTLALDGNPTYRPDDEERGTVQDRASAAATGDPFFTPWRAGKPMLDLAAAFSALDNARAGREFDSWYQLDLLMQRLPALTEQDERLIDEDYLLSINFGLRKLDSRENLPAVCSGLEIPRELEKHAADIPLGWSLSARAQKAIKCVTERAAAERLKRMRIEVPGWATQKAEPTPGVPGKQ